MPSAFIRVVDPVSLKFVVHPGQNWVLEVGRTYEVYLRLYDSEKHQLFVTEVNISNRKTGATLVYGKFLFRRTWIFAQRYRRNTLKLFSGRKTRVISLLNRSDEEKRN